MRKDPGYRALTIVSIIFFSPLLSVVNPILKGPCIRFFLQTNNGAIQTGEWTRAEESFAPALRFSGCAGMPQSHRLDKIIVSRAFTF